MDDFSKELEQDGMAALSMDDVNALLVKAGLTPIGEDAAPQTPQESKKSGDIQSPRDAAPQTEPTRHFSLSGAQAGSSVPSQATRVVARQPDAAPPVQKDEPQSDSQILLDGFDKTEGPQHVSEAEVQANLKTRRKNLVENFRVLAQPEDDQPLLEKDVEGNGANSVFDSLEVKQGEPLFDAVANAREKHRLPKRVTFDRSKLTQRLTPQPQQASPVELNARRDTLKAQKKKLQAASIATLCLFGLTLLLTVCASFYVPGGALEFLFGHGARPFTFLNLLLLLAAAAISVETFKQAVLDVRAQRVTASVCVVALSALAALHSLWMLIASMDENTGYISFAVCGVFALLAQTAVRLIGVYAEDNDLAVLQNCETVRRLRPVESEADAAALCHGVTAGKTPKILYAAASKNKGFVMPASFEGMHGKVYLYGLLLAAVLSLVFALVRAFSEKSAALFINAFVSCAFLCAPLLRLLLSMVLKTKNDAALASTGVVVSGLDAAAALGGADAVVVDAADLFEARVSNFRAVPGGGMSKQDAAVYAAAALQDSESLLAASFSTLAQELGRRIPQAEDLQYEEKLGYGCWVAGRRVLVGKRDMLVQHSVPAPSEQEEKAYAGKREVLYVVVEGLVAATFTVGYRARKEARHAARIFNKSGLLLMFTAGDPSLSEEFAAQKLTLDVSAIKLMNSKNARLIADLRAADDSAAPDGLVSGGKKSHLLLLVSAARRLYEADRMAGGVFLAGQAFCFLLLLLCVIFKISSFFMPLTVIFLQLLWSFAAYYVGTTRIK